MASWTYAEVEKLSQEEKNQMLVSSCKKGNLDDVKTLVSANAEVNAVDNYGALKGYTALYHAVYWNKPSVVQYLISQKVKIDEKSVEENEDRLNGIISAVFLNEFYTPQQIVERYRMHGLLTSKTTQEILAKLEHDKSEVEKQHESQYDGKCITKQGNIKRYKEALQLYKKQILYKADEASEITFGDIEEYLSTVTSQEDETARNIRIMLVGNEGVGKTSLCLNLLEENLPDGGPRSTDGIDIYIQRFVIDMVTKNRKKIPEGEEHQHILQKLGEHVQKHKRPRSNSDTDRNYNKQRKTTDIRKFNSVGDDQKMPPTDPGCSIHNDKEEIQKEDERTVPDTSIEEPITKPVSVPEELYDDLHRLFKQEESDPHDKCYAPFWDFSGERDYYNTHHVFLTSDAVYLLVFNLSDCFKSEEWIKRMIFWLRSIATHTENENVVEKPKEGPPIILIGTHLDQLKGTDKEINVMIKEMYSELVKNEMARKIVNHHVRGFYQVSNITSIKQVIPKIWEDILSSAPL